MQRIGIIGYGFAGRGFHAPLIRRVQGLTITAAVARDPARRAEALADGIPAVYGALEDLLAAQAADVALAFDRTVCRRCLGRSPQVLSSWQRVRAPAGAIGQAA